MRAHLKAEKRKERKANEGEGNKAKTLIADVEEIPEAESPAKKKCIEQTLTGHLQGNVFVEVVKAKVQAQKSDGGKKETSRKNAAENCGLRWSCGRKC